MTFNMSLNRASANAGIALAGVGQESPSTVARSAGEGQDFLGRITHEHETEEAKNRWYAKEVKATFKNGVLEVTTPVRASAPPPLHKVEVSEPEERVTVAA